MPSTPFGVGAVTPGDNIFIAPKLSGPWSSLSYNISHMGAYTYRSNPSLAIDSATGEAVLAFRTQPTTGAASGETIGIAIAAAWSAGTYVSVAEPIIPGVANQEDPFIWRHSRGWSVLTHHMTSGAVGGLFVSPDGVKWKQSPLPAYTTNVTMTGPGWKGGRVTFARRERPELLFDAVTGRATHLLTGCMQNNVNGGGGVNFQRSFSVMTALGGG